MADRKANSTYTLNEKFLIECDLTYAVNKIGGRWKILITDNGYFAIRSDKVLRKLRQGIIRQDG